MDTPRALCRPAFEAIKRGALSWSSKRPLLDGCAPRLFHGVWWRAALTMRLFPVPCVLTQHAEKVPLPRPNKGSKPPARR